MKKCLSSVPILITFLLFVGCSSAPKGDSSQVLNSYYLSIKDDKAAVAYDMLSKASQKNFAKEDFIKWRDLQKEIYTYKEAKVEKAKEYTNKEIDGITYKNVVEFNVTETTFDFYKNKDVTSTYTRNVVSDNGEWKVYRGKENGKQIVAQSSNYLGCMYSAGKGKSKDFNQAILVLKEGIKYDPDYSLLYYNLGYAYQDLGRNTEALDAINTFISKETDSKNKSAGYNILGTIYTAKIDMANAKAAYAKAIELDPDNEYAKSNLANLEKY